VTDFRLVARVDGDGLMWPDELIEALDAATGLEWRRDQEREKREVGPSQGGAGQIILDAAAGAVAEAALTALRERAHETLDSFLKRLRDKRPGTVLVEPFDPQDEDDPGEDAAEA
jgi:hypothetical protein